MTQGHFSPILGYFKIAVREALKPIHALRKSKPRIISSVLRVEAPSVEGAQAQYPLLKSYVEAYSHDCPPALLVFGDSVFLRVATDDQSPLSLGEILGLSYQDGMLLVSGSGYHSGVFEQFSAVLEALPARPRMAVVPINLRIFSPTWDLDPLYQFQSEIELLSSFDLKRPDYTLHDAKLSTKFEEQGVSMELDGEKIISLSEFFGLIKEGPAIGSKAWKDRLKTIFACHYMYPLNTEHRKIKSLKKTIKRLNGIGVSVYCYITPINYEAGLEYCGDVFVQAVEDNISKIQREIGSVSPAVFTGNDALAFQFDNFAFQFDRSVFFTPHNATEHLRFEGRELIAKRIVEAERALLKHAY